MPSVTGAYLLVLGIVVCIATLAIFVLRKRYHDSFRTMRNVRSLLETGRDGLWELDLTTSILVTSPVFEENLDLGSSIPVTWNDYRKLIHPEDLPILDFSFATLQHPETPAFDGVFRLRNAKGEYQYHRLRARVSARHPGGKPSRLTGLQTNVHATHILQDVLRQNYTLLAAQRNLIPDAIIAINEHDEVIDLNETFQAMWDLQPGVVNIGDHFESNVALWKKFGEHLRFDDLQVLHADGRFSLRFIDNRIIEYLAGAMLRDGTKFGRTLFFRDVSQQRATERELRLTRTALDQVQAPINWFSENGTIIYSNQMAATVFGIEKAPSLIGKKIWQSLSFLSEVEWHELWNELKERRVLVREYDLGESGVNLEVFYNYVSDDYQEYSFNYIRDISHRKSWEMRLENLAFHDPITGLPNLRLFSRKFESAIAREAQTPIALLLVDLDNFKTINDCFNHKTGDALLQAVAERIRTTLRDDEPVARSGGDEFQVGLYRCKNVEDIRTRAEELVRAIGKPFYVFDQEFLVTASIGISIYPYDADTWDELHTFADTAMYRAKEEGRNGFSFFSPDMKENLLRNHQIGMHLHHALERKELYLVYQPQVNTNVRRLSGFEVLARWSSKELGDIPPDIFIAIAESNGLIVSLGYWVLENACSQMAIWNTEFNSRLTISVNVSAVQLKATDFVQNVLAILDRTGLDPQLLEIEITESTIIRNMDNAITMLRQLRSHGISTAIDDFGTGYSSLQYLQKLPLDKLKIDKCFIDTMLEDQESIKVIRIIIALGKTMGLKVIAEGVESLEQLEFLQEEGCECIQGHYFGAAMHIEESHAFIKQFISGSSGVFHGGQLPLSLP